MGGGGGGGTVPSCPGVTVRVIWWSRECLGSLLFVVAASRDGAVEGEADLGLRAWSRRELLLVLPVVLGNCGRGLHLGLTSCSPGSLVGNGETVGKRRLHRFDVTMSCNPGSFTRSTKA